jgi:hypothetical protein
MNKSDVMFGALITGIIIIGIKVSYEIGRSAAIHQIYRRGWAVVMPDEDTDEKDQ